MNFAIVRMADILPPLFTLSKTAVSNFILQIRQVVVETSSAKTIVLEVDDALQDKFQFKPGQYLTISAPSGHQGKFSIISAPTQDTLAFTVKKINDDQVSAYLFEQIKPGDSISVSTPAGMAGVKTNADRRITYYMIAGGSGITSLYALIRGILDEEPLSTVHLLYANRDVADIIYRSELNELVDRHQHQFYLRHYLSSPTTPAFIDHWDGKVGRITPISLDKYLLDFPKQTLTEKFFICGPAKMSATLSAHLARAGRDNIYVEQFNQDSVKMETKQTDHSKAKVHLDGEIIEIDIKDQSILQTLIDAGYDPPFSCTSGVCTTCMAKLKTGQVDMEVNYGLDEDEVADGFILTCQSHPTSDEIELTYDV